MTFYQWVTIGAIVAGFLGTWLVGAFTLGRAVEQMKAGFKEEISAERDKIFTKIESLEERFLTDQRTQDHNFGEVGAAMRQYTADVEKKLREVEIYGRDNYVKIPDFEKAIDRMGETMAAAVTEIKEDMRRLLKPI
jgi:cytosine/adenosine deaminase-related metal-dependent hydrolase